MEAYRPPLDVAMDPSSLDLVARLPEFEGKTIAELELPYICDMRPHEEPHVEAWLQKWVDGDGLGEEGDEVPLLESRCQAGLCALVEERPEALPGFRKELGRFGRAVQVWLRSWPSVEPWRDVHGCRVASAPSPEGLELELYAVLLLLQGGEASALAPALAAAPLDVPDEVREHFRQVAFGWIFKLHTVYGLHLLGQPERLAALAGAEIATDLSLLRWSANQVEGLLGCPFFRPKEQDLWYFVRRWRAEAGEGGGDSLTKALVWELLPKPEELEAKAFAEDEDPGRPRGGGDSDQGALERAEQTSTQVHGDSFELVPRLPSCSFASYDEPSAFRRMAALPGSDARLHCWNAAEELQVLGASRQMFSSSFPMKVGEGVWRLELRVVSGTTGEAAHLLEVGLAAQPKAGVCFTDAGAFRPAAVDGDASPFFPLFSILDSLLEGVRLVVEADLRRGLVLMRNVPGTPGEREPTAVPLAPWFAGRAQVEARSLRPREELDSQLFREHAEHLQDLADRERLNPLHTKQVRGDGGVQAVTKSITSPYASESYYFYVVVPRGIELEVF